MAQPIPTVTDKVHTQAPKWNSPDGAETSFARIRRETATAILAGSAAASRGGGLDAVTDSAIEWADMLLEKLSRG